MAIPTFTMKRLIEAGIHYGHQTRRWNPKMAPYIYGIRNKIHIIDLEKTVPLLKEALTFLRNVAAKGGRVLFVGTKQQASAQIKESAQKCGQFYINHRWLGGLLTNWKTVNQSIKRLRDMEANLATPLGLTKKEILKLTRQHQKLDLAIGGIRDMGGVPDALFVIDTNKEDIAILEANRLNIPVIAILDTNSNPKGIEYPIPGNDDALRSIHFYCDLVVGSILDGLHAEIMSTGIDIGSSSELLYDPNYKGRKSHAPKRRPDNRPDNRPDSQQARRSEQGFDVRHSEPLPKKNQEEIKLTSSHDKKQES
jgi:small subunit ribosomal protein S2